MVVYHCYSDDDIDQGPMHDWFTLSEDCSDEECRDERCRGDECRMVFTIQDVPGYVEADDPRTGKAHYAYCKKVLIAAIKAGYLTEKGTQFPPPPAQLSLPEEMFTALEQVRKLFEKSGSLFSPGVVGDFEIASAAVNLAIDRYKKAHPSR